MDTSLFSKTPKVMILDNRGQAVRDIAYHRHPDSPDVTSERITRHQYDARSFLTHSVDPRLYDAGLVNFTWLTDLNGTVLRTQSVDAGITVALHDVSGRALMVVSNITLSDQGTEDRSQAVIHTRQYENAALPGRPISITEQVAGGTAQVTQRFVYAADTAEGKARNLAGQCICYYDTAGLMQVDSILLTGVTCSVTRRLLKDADRPATVADWQGNDASAWNKQLDDEVYTTLTTADATGAVLTTTDAKGNVQRVAYDVAGMLSGSWLTLKGGNEQVIVKSLTYSAAGQKLCEQHGNGVVTTYTYEPETQRLVGIKTERLPGHPSGAKVLQDLRYQYDPVGNLLVISSDAEESRFYRNQIIVPENTYTYDSLYQLVSATGREMANTNHLSPVITPVPVDLSILTRYTRTYLYDNAGNLTQMRHSAPATNNRYTTTITVSDRSNRGVLSTLTTTPSDVDGLFTAGGQQKLLQPGQRVSWTPANQLLTVIQVARDNGADDQESYRYDAGGRRMLKISTQKTINTTQTQRGLYLPELELRTTKTGDSGKEDLQVICVSAAGRAQVRILRWVAGKPAEISNDQVRYSYDNLAGSSLLELDSDGNVISMEEYYPFGGTAVWAARSVVEANYKTVRYSGKERDATGLYYYGFRYYQPWVGRWLSADPAGTQDGLNLFRMVRNNPVTLSDNDGLSPETREEARARERRNRGALLAMQQQEQRVDPALQMIEGLLQQEEGVTTSQSPVMAPQSAPLATTVEEPDEEEEFTHEHALKGLGLKLLALRFMPMRFFTSSLVKKISGQNIRPKTRRGEEYRSTGDFSSKKVAPQEVRGITEQFRQRASDIMSKIESHSLAVNADVHMNIKKSVHISEYLEGLAGEAMLNQKNRKMVPHFYKLLRAGSTHPYALALVTYDAENNLLMTHGVVVHPDALMRNPEGEFDVRGAGTSLSILSIIRALKAHPSASKIRTNAVNKFSGRIFDKAINGL